MREPFYELTRDDVGRAMIHAFGRCWVTTDFIGHVMTRDVGKRVYRRGEIVQVENDEQRAERLNRENVIHYELSHSERAAISEPTRNGAQLDCPEMLCWTSDGHAKGTRHRDHVTCRQCLHMLKTFRPYRGEE